MQYWQQWGAKDPAYFAKRLADADVFRGGKPATNSAQPVARSPYVVPSSIADLVRKRGPVTAALQAPDYGSVY